MAMAMAMLLRFLAGLLYRLNCFGGRDLEEAASPSNNSTPTIYEDLLPGLPSALVLESILPHIPWYARPRLKATSRAWCSALDSLSSIDHHRARNVSQIYRAYRGIDTSGGDLIEVRCVKECSYDVFLYDPEQELWHKLPPIPCGFLRPQAPILAGFFTYRQVKTTIQVAFVCGKVIASTLYDVSNKGTFCGVCIWMLDIEGGMWKWEERRNVSAKRNVDRDLWNNMLVLKEKLYILRDAMYDSRVPIVYNVAADEWEQLSELPSCTSYSLGWIPWGARRQFIKCVFAMTDGGKKTLDPCTGKWKDYRLLHPTTPDPSCVVVERAYHSRIFDMIVGISYNFVRDNETPFRLVDGTLNVRRNRW